MRAPVRPTERNLSRDVTRSGPIDRCNQETLLAQLHGGVRSLRSPVDNLTNTGAYRVMTALAWNLKAWRAFLLPAPPGRW